MVNARQVTPHHRDPVTAGPARAAGRQQPRRPEPVIANDATSRSDSARASAARITKIR
jgi:hypothetical protein